MLKVKNRKKKFTHKFKLTQAILEGNLLQFKIKNVNTQMFIKTASQGSGDATNIKSKTSAKKHMKFNGLSILRL